MKRHLCKTLITLCALALSVGCAGVWSSDAPFDQWHVQEIAAITEGLDNPECAVPDPRGFTVYVSNVETSDEGYWVDDGKGFISAITYDGKMKDLRWVDSTAEAPLHAPKGMCILNDYLYFTDNVELKRVRLDRSQPVEVLPLVNNAQLNDLASDGEQYIYVTDTGRGRIVRMSEDGEQMEIPSPRSVNGITVHEGSLYAVSWGERDIYTLDPRGVRAPRPFGLSEHFESLDGIEVLEDGSFLVSDFIGGKVSIVAPDRKTVYTLIELVTPADFGLDRRRGLLYVPELTASRLRVYTLWQDADRPRFEVD